MSPKTTFAKMENKEPIAHIIFWCIVFFSPYLKHRGYEISILHELNDLLFILIPTYIIYFWFCPSRNKIKNIPIVVLLFALNAIAFNFFHEFFHPNCNEWWRNSISNIITSVTFSFIFFTLYAFKESQRKQVELDTIIREKNRAELEGLKAQINPHFLFNTLNAIYANALKDNNKTPEMILKLSDSFRYMINEGQQEKVSLKKEIAYIKNYIDLQKERLTDKIVVHWKENMDTYTQEIPPLLLISFVENAFKYTSMLKGKGHEIKIEISLKNNQFLFYCENPSPKNEENEIELNWKNSGIGIQNTKQRLSLLYPEKHQLSIISDAKLFKVNLKIQL